jgi:preprotein translocase subunit SecE
MAMNREQKRLLQRQGYVGADGELIQQRRERSAPAAREQRERTGPKKFLKEMRDELRKVHWPSRQEVVHYSLVVLVFLVVVTTIVALVDWVFARAVLWLFGVE